MFTLHTQEFWKIISFPRIDIFENTTKKLSYHSTEKTKSTQAFFCFFLHFPVCNATQRWFFLGEYWGHETWVEDQRAKGTIAP